MNIVERIKSELIKQAVKSIEEMQMRNRKKNMGTTKKQTNRSKASVGRIIEFAGVKLSLCELEGIIRSIRKLRYESTEEMNPETSAYERGYYNAVENILAKFENRHPVIVPADPISERNKQIRTEDSVNKVLMNLNFRPNNTDEENKVISAEAVVDNFMSGIIEREQDYPEILGKIMDRILWKLSHDAEVLQERTVTAKSRLEDALKVLARGGSKKN